MALIPRRVLLNGWNAFLKKSENLRSSYNGLKIISSEHERIHAGWAFLNKDRYVVPPSTTVYYLFKVESGDQDTHVRNFGFVSDQGPMELHFREAPSYDADSMGVMLSLENMNRASVNSSGLQLFGNPAGIDTNSLGLHLDYILQPESAPGNQPAGGAGQHAVTEWRIDNSKVYLFSLNNLTANSATIESNFFVYRTD